MWAPVRVPAAFDFGGLPRRQKYANLVTACRGGEHRCAYGGVSGYGSRGRAAADRERVVGLSVAAWCGHDVAQRSAFTQTQSSSGSAMRGYPAKKLAGPLGAKGSTPTAEQALKRGHSVPAGMMLTGLYQ